MYDAALVNKLVPCAWLLSGALEVWRLQLRLLCFQVPFLRLAIQQTSFLLLKFHLRNPRNTGSSVELPCSAPSTINHRTIIQVFGICQQNLTEFYSHWTYVFVSLELIKSGPY